MLCIKQIFKIQERFKVLSEFAEAQYKNSLLKLNTPWDINNCTVCVRELDF